MPVLGLIAGLLLGGMFGKLDAVLGLGLLGLIIGIIVSVSRKPAEHVVERRLRAIEDRLAALETQQSAQPAPTPQPAPAAAPAPQLAPAPAPKPAPAPQPAAAAAPPPVAIAAPPPPLPPVAPPPRKEPPAKPSEPDPIVAWLLGGNTIVRVGLLVLFLGLGFLVKYGVEHQLVPVELRVAGVGAVGVVLLILGWRLRDKRAGYALSLQGTGVAVLYLTIFGALRLYGLIPAPLAFALLVAIAALSAFLAVKQDSLVFAMFAEAGGFLAPVLASTGQGNHVMLFSYYVLLNASIVAIAWFKAWRSLNLVGFIFTALIGLAWGVRSYRDDLFASTEPFLITFFLMYVAIAILFARKESQASARYVDGTIVFGTPIFAFGMQAGLLHDTEFGLAYSSVAAAAIYLVAAAALYRAGRDRWRMLAESFLALGVVFATLAIPLAFDARWTSAAWALEGAAVLWVGLRQRRRIARAFGILMQVLAGAAFGFAHSAPAGPPFADAVFLGAIILVVTGLASYRLLKRPEADMSAESSVLSPAFFLWALAWLLVAGEHEIRTFVQGAYRPAVWIAFLAAIALGFGIVAVRRGWQEARWPGLALAPVLVAIALWFIERRMHTFGNGGWAAWPFAIGVLFFLLKRLVPDSKAQLAMPLHVLSVALVALVGALEIEWLATEYTAPGSAWALASRIVAPSIVLLLIASRAADSRWPVRDNLAAYRIDAVTLLVIAMALWSLHVNWAHEGGSEPLPYMPLLNALDLAHVLAALAIIAAVMAARRSGLRRPEFLAPQLAFAAAGVVAFVWANSMLLRTIHHWAGVPYKLEPLMRSVLVQASLSVFWSFLALALMVFATRRGMRVLWIVGAVLMAVVVAKLALVDLGHLSGIERIVSFIGVGVLMLVIGYFSPVPPRKTEGA